MAQDYAGGMVDSGRRTDGDGNGYAFGDNLPWGGVYSNIPIEQIGYGRRAARDGVLWGFTALPWGVHGFKNFRGGVQGERTGVTVATPLGNFFQFFASYGFLP